MKLADMCDLMELIHLHHGLIDVFKSCIVVSHGVILLICPGDRFVILIKIYSFVFCKNTIILLHRICSIQKYAFY